MVKCLMVCLLVACTYSHDVQALCACTGYFPNKAKPQWVDHEQINRQNYISQGSSYCSGVKKPDVARANKSALANLARMVSAQVMSEQNMQQADYGMGVTVDRFSQSTLIKTDVSLKQAKLFDYWLDQANCTLYVGASISKFEVQRSRLKQQLRLINQIFYLPKEAHLIQNWLADLAVTTTNEQKHSQILIDVSVRRNDGDTDKLLKLTLQVQFIHRQSKQVIWQQNVPGKGLSFESKSENALYQAALADGYERLKQPLLNAIKTITLKSGSR